MWTDENRARCDRSQLRYPSDLTDAEWDLVRPCIPPCKRGGRQRWVDLREVVNGVMYVLSTGLPVARGAEGPAAAQHAARLSRLVGMGRHAGAYPPRALRPLPRAGRPPSQSNRR